MSEEELLQEIIDSQEELEEMSEKAEFLNHLKNGIRTFEVEYSDEDNLKIKGVALEDGKFRGLYYPRKVLSNSANTLENEPIVVDHDKGIKDIVGQVTNSKWEDNQLKFEGEIINDEIAELIKRNLVSGVSIGADVEETHTKKGRTAEEVDFYELALTTNPVYEDGIKETLSKHQELSYEAPTEGGENMDDEFAALVVSKSKANELSEQLEDGELASIYYYPDKEGYGSPYGYPDYPQPEGSDYDYPYPETGEYGYPVPKDFLSQLQDEFDLSEEDLTDFVKSFFENVSKEEKSEEKLDRDDVEEVVKETLKQELSEEEDVNQTSESENKSSETDSEGEKVESQETSEDTEDEVENEEDEMEEKEESEEKTKEVDEEKDTGSEEEEKVKSEEEETKEVDVEEIANGIAEKVGERITEKINEKIENEINEEKVKEESEDREKTPDKEDTEVDEKEVEEVNNETENVEEKSEEENFSPSAAELLRARYGNK